MLLKQPGDPGAAPAVADNAQLDLSLELRRLGFRRRGISGQACEAGQGRGRGCRAQGAAQEPTAVQRLHLA